VENVHVLNNSAHSHNPHLIQRFCHEQEDKELTAKYAVKCNQEKANMGGGGIIREKIYNFSDIM
jgi:hypothetical protein